MIKGDGNEHTQLEMTSRRQGNNGRIFYLDARDMLGLTMVVTAAVAFYYYECFYFRTFPST